MSILIKNMDMPQSCNDCPLAGDYKCNLMPSIPALCKEYDIAVRNKKRLDNCPLVKLPPHGRLIDADALRLLYDFNGYKPTGGMAEEEFDRLMCRLPVIRANIDDAPTIIESTIGQLNSDSAVNEAEEGE